MTVRSITVSQLNEYIKNLFASDRMLSAVCVTGELSNFKRHSSGHLYFTLKDSDAAVQAVMFRSDAARLRFSPESGMKVIVTGRVSLYPKSGQYQIYVNTMQPDGIGSLYLAFEQLKEKLYRKGLFDPAHKKALPQYPKRIAVVTSPTGAAVRDMIRILNRRYPLCDVLVCPVKVQGDGAAQEIADMLDYVNQHRMADLIITGRGGGSLEDLWAFNEEVLAEAVYRSDIPVISAVGHEPDITISDYVADARASTPSNAAEIAVKDAFELKRALGDLAFTLAKYQNDRIKAERTRLARLTQTPVMTDPRQYFTDRRLSLDVLSDRLASSMRLTLERRRAQTARLAAGLDAMSPLKVLSRGYSVVTDGRGVVRSVGRLEPGGEISVRLSDGSADCTVVRVTKEQKENVS